MLETLLPYALPAGVASFLAWRWFRFRRVRKALPELLAQGASILDVRSRSEFDSGHIPGSINIPLDELAAGAAKLDKKKPLLVCCASGARSGMAATLLMGKGFRDVRNAGPWRNLVTEAT